MNRKKIYNKMNRDICSITATEVQRIHEKIREEKIKDGCGFPISNGFYKDINEMHFYHIMGYDGIFKIREDIDKKYHPLDEILASSLIRVPNKLVSLINSVQALSQPKWNEPSSGGCARYRQNVSGQSFISLN